MATQAPNLLFPQKIPGTFASQSLQMSGMLPKNMKFLFMISVCWNKIFGFPKANLWRNSKVLKIPINF
uniref:Uncharacterized protein n=1 Tax=Acrobeloides nanus TaxID=290746 RepID=A0A914E6X0_9BILA